MPPLWEPDEAEPSVYSDIQEHSEGMISFTYRPPSKADLDVLRNTETYRKLIEESREKDMGESPHQGASPASRW
jgi:hypothetical protein